MNSHSTPNSAEWLKDRLAKAISTSGTNLENLGSSFSTDDAIVYLNNGGIETQLNRLDAIISNRPDGIRFEIMGAANEALASIANRSPLTSNAIFGLEALVLLIGRPVLRTVNGEINLQDPRLGEWHDKLYLAQRPPYDLSISIKSVGRVDQGGGHVGTGFVVGKGLVLTNRHVVECFGKPNSNGVDWDLHGEVTVDFSDAPSDFDSALRFKVQRIVGVGTSSKQRPPGEFNVLDAALLQVEQVNLAGAPLPCAIDLNPSESSLGGLDELLVIGYPARPARLPVGNDGKIDELIADRLREIFDEYGVRTVSPGIRLWDGKASDGYVFLHDATTLGGSSGSCILSLDGHGVGLHFAGAWRSANYAHGLASMRLTEAFMSTPGLSWIKR